MARQRFIWPSLWDDPVIGHLTPIQRLFFIGCFSNADDEGRLLGDPAYLRGTIFKYDDMTLTEVREIRDAVAAVCKHFVVYEADGTEYIAFLKWTEYQKPKYPKPSKLPPPPSANVSASLEKPSPNLSGSFPENSSLGWDGLGRDGLGRTTTTPTPPPSQAPAASAGSESFVVVVKAFEQEIGRTPTPNEAEQLFAYVEDDHMEPAVVAMAIRQARAQGKPRLAYMNGILRNWRASGALTALQVTDLEAARERERQGKPDPAEAARLRREREENERRLAEETARAAAEAVAAFEKEHGVPATPENVRRVIREKLKSGGVFAGTLAAALDGRGPP